MNCAVDFVNVRNYLRALRAPWRVLVALLKFIYQVVNSQEDSNMSNVKIREVAIPNVTISACKLRRAYQGKYGLQYGAHLSGEGLAEIGLKEANDGGYWYSTNAKYGSMDVEVPPVDIMDENGEDITDDLENGAKAHMLFELRDYPAGVRKDGTKFKAGTNVRLVAVRALDFNVKQSKQDRLSSALLGLEVESDSKASAELFS